MLCPNKWKYFQTKPQHADFTIVLFQVSQCFWMNQWTEWIILRGIVKHHFLEYCIMPVTLQMMLDCKHNCPTRLSGNYVYRKTVVKWNALFYTNFMLISTNRRKRETLFSLIINSTQCTKSTKHTRTVLLSAAFFHCPTVSPK